jgi:type I restriction enzyme S subunit
MLIKNFAQILNGKISTNLLNSSSYISTENMIANFGGVCNSVNIPTGKCTEFHTKDILISNIRPYFKKFWYANFNGGCSNDVLAIRTNNQCISRYLYYSLCSNKFVDLYVASCKGTKMPRGNKDVLLNYNLELPNIEFQQHIVDIIQTLFVKCPLPYLQVLCFHL